MTVLFGDVRFTPKADIGLSNAHVRLVPGAAYAPQQIASLFDDLVGTGEQCLWHRKAKRLGGLEIDDETACTAAQSWR